MARKLNRVAFRSRRALNRAIPAEICLQPLESRRLLSASGTTATETASNEQIGVDPIVEDPIDTAGLNLSVMQRQLMNNFTSTFQSNVMNKMPQEPGASDDERFDNAVWDLMKSVPGSNGRTAASGLDGNFFYTINAAGSANSVTTRTTEIIDHDRDFHTSSDINMLMPSVKAQLDGT